MVDGSGLMVDGLGLMVDSSAIPEPFLIQIFYIFNKGSYLFADRYTF